MRRLFAVLMALTMMVESSALYAQDQQTWTLKGSAELGAEHNTNIAVTELETASDRSDNGLLFEGNLSVNWRPVEKLNAETGYSFSTRRFREVTSFDLDMHLFYADVSYDADIASIGANYYHADADLGGRSFLGLRQYSLYAGRMLGDTWYLRAALNRADKSFPTFTARNADNEGVSMDAFWFFNQGRSSLSAGYVYEDETTLAPEFMYTAHTLRLRYSLRFMILSRQARFQAGIRWHDRNFSREFPGLGRLRDDRQVIADTRLEVNMTEWVSVIGRIELGDYSSNFSPADFNDNRASLSVKAAF